MENTKFCCMLVGAAGAGKSSFINTLIKYVNTMRDAGQKLKRYIPTAKAQAMGGHTMTREPIKVMDDLIIVDNRGWHDWHNKAALKELAAQIHGNRPFDDDVIWDDDSNSATIDESDMTMAITDKVDCTTVVINGIGGIDAVENIAELLETCRKNTKRSPSVVITHKDKLSDEAVQQMIVFLENEKIYADRVFVVKNVTSKDESLEDETRSSIRNFIESCRDDGEDGAIAHKRREEVKKNREKKNVLEFEKEILSDQNKLTKARITDAKAQLDIEKESKRNTAFMRKITQQRELDHATKLQDLSAANVKDMNALKLENESDLHEHRKIYVKDFYAGQLHKILPK